MSRTLPAQVQTQYLKQKNKPRVGVYLTYFEKALAVHSSFTAEIDDSSGSWASPNLTGWSGDPRPGDTVTADGPSVPDVYTIVTVSGVNITLNKTMGPTGPVNFVITRAYDGLTDSAPSTSAAAKRLGGLAQITDVSMSVVNAGLWSDILNGKLQPEKSVVEIWKYYDDGTTILQSESVLQFKGVISDFPSVSYSSFPLSFNSSDFDFAENDVIPRNLVDESDYINIADDSIGTPYPVIFGDSSWTRGGDPLDSDVSGDVPAVLAKFLRIDENGDHIFLIAGHELNDITTADIWVYDKTLQRVLNIDDAQVTITNVDGNGNAIAAITPDSSGLVTFVDYLYGTGSAGTSGTPGFWLNPDNSVDRDADSFAGFDTNKSILAGNSQTMVMEFQGYSDAQLASIDTISSKQVFALTDWGVTVEDASTVFTVNGFTAKGGDPLVNGWNFYGTLTDPGDNVNAVISASNNRTITKLQVFECAQKITMDITFDPNRHSVLAAVKGVESDTWIDGRSTSESDPNTGDNYTVTHPDDDTSGAAPDNPVTQIELLLRDSTFGFNLGDSNIEMNSFNIAADARSAWKFRFALDKQNSAIDTLERMVYEAGCLLRWNENDRAEILALDASAPFTISGTGTPNGREIYDFDPTTSSGSFTEQPIINESFTLGKVSAEFATDLTVNYYRNYQSKQFQGSSNTTQNVSTFGTIKKTEDLQFIKDDATAVLLRDIWINLISEKPIGCGLRTIGNPEVEVWDIINIRHPILDGIYGTSTMNSKKWLVLNITGNAGDDTTSIQTVAL